jgi:hypothetical protein
LHNVIANNIVAGEVDQSPKHTDGNGIILDLSDRSYRSESANTPAALVVNNVVYGNGGRCVEAYVVTNFWMANNICYKNNLDAAVGKAGAITVNNSHHGYVINNIVQVWNGATRCYDEENSVSRVRYDSNLCFGSDDRTKGFDAQHILCADPLFVNAPYFHATEPAQYGKAMSPSLLGDGLTLQASSPAIGKGIDPTTLPDLPEAVARDLKKYIYADINGKPRPERGKFDLGAYQSTHLRLETGNESK